MDTQQVMRQADVSAQLENIGRHSSGHGQVGFSVAVGDQEIPILIEGYGQHWNVGAGAMARVGTVHAQWKAGYLPYTTETRTLR